MFDGTILFHVRGGQGRLVGLYDFKALYRGDLGQVLRWTAEAAGGVEPRANADLEDGDVLLDPEAGQHEPEPAGEPPTWPSGSSRR